MWGANVSIRVTRRGQLLHVVVGEGEQFGHEPAVLASVALPVHRRWPPIPRPSAPTSRPRRWCRPLRPWVVGVVPTTGVLGMYHDR